MAEHYNHLKQPVGPPLKGWQACKRPPQKTMRGQYCSLVPLDPDAHAAQLYEGFMEDDFELLPGDMIIVDEKLLNF